MFKGKRWMLTTATAALVLAAGCTNGQAGTGGADGTAQLQESAGSGEQKTPTIKIFAPDLSKAVPAGNLAQDPTVKYMMDKSGMNLNISFLPNANYVDQLKLKFAANDFPDVYMGFGLTQGDGALDNGLILPLNELIEQHGPNLKKYIPQYAWDAVTINGKIMGIPEPSNTPSSRLFYVRKDWMDKLGITKMPATSDELLEMLRKFRDSDANGNGKKDEIAFTMREKFSWTGDMIWGMWGISPYEGIEYNGEIVPGFVHPNFKKGLAFMQTMHKEGLLDSEFLVNSSSIWKQKIASGLAGSWGFTPQGAYEYQKVVQDGLPGQKVDVVTIPTPRGTGYDGPIGSVNFPVNKTYLIMKSSKDPAAVVKLFDWLFSEEGQIFSELGVKGINYGEENGIYFYKEASEQEQKTEWRALFKMHAHNEAAFNARYTGIQRDKMQQAINISNKEGLTSLTMGMPAVGQNLFNLYSEFHEPAARIIAEGAPVEATWEQFVKDWRAMGGQELIDEMTKWVKENKRK
ncbi:putative aldouronate transport system substrate-binding protein [Paenibacillus sp. UNCCL117]|uniref:extracellular solute-binding protein n=1 Tax=unclassified Paenibacillus TaxID=185978 RepID=UPI00088D0527|nr:MULTISPECIES: extracellular solute-binding protein [unclassified Paenibacillus]SDD65446.1 putative aldouronate transport system substrate-binding protein [Paenibacillus sp. cl123]SFW58123.1 putative aldouronate transport system substrate-binding protein [Paenibacillus sp. UNCCL117]